LTKTPISNTGECCRAEGFPSALLSPEHWSAQTMYPLQCLKVELVVHQLPDRSVSCWAYEVSDAHTKELLAKHVQPYVRPSDGLGLSADVSDALAVALIALLDPDPF